MLHGPIKIMTIGRSNNMKGTSSYPLLNSLQIFRDVFFREAQRSTCAVTGQSFTSDLTHDCRAGDAATKLLYIFNGVLRSLALKIRINLQLVRCVRFHSSLGGKAVFCLLVLIYGDVSSLFEHSRLLRTKSWHWFHCSLVNESATGDPPLRFFFLALGKR